MSVIIITGSCGLVGSEAVNFFCNKGFEVVGIDNNTRKILFGKDGDTNWVKKKLKTNFKNYKHFHTDIRNKKKIEKIFKFFRKNISLILHCAAQPSHDWAYKNPRLDFEINALSTLNLLELFKKYSPSSKFIHMSTNKVYGDNPNKLSFIEKKNRIDLNKKNKLFKGIDETFSLDRSTHSLFGVSKTYSDLLVQEFGNNFGIKTVTFRAGCITGPSHSSAKLHGFLSFLVKNLIQKKKYQIIGYHGKQVRDNIHAHDLVSCFWEYYKKPTIGEVYNIGGGRFSNCSILEAISLVQKKINKKIKIEYFNTPRRGDHKWYISNCDKFRKHYPKWKQKYNTEKIIFELYDNYCQLR
ncbi:NAD-dependent epimerase/dehydratase family protein [Candidatus Pelagibacter sp. HIMB1542]|uniref:NAD-dependent epimerase/dehydratase family protein n=1 Tax=Candidatus Pelagibacter sp. HIMB1542 TaxID=3413346 RepID=UPI003F84577B